MAVQTTHGRDGLLIVANWPSDVGYAWWFMERIWVTLAEYWAAAGGRTHVVFPEVREFSDAMREAPVEMHELDFSDRSREGRRRLKALVDRHGIRSVYLTDRATLDPLYGLLRLWGVERIVNNDQTPGDRSTSWLKRTTKSLLHRLGVFTPDVNIAPSRFVMERFDRTYGLPASRSVLIPNGIVPVDMEVDPRYVNREFGIPGDARVAVSLSRAVDYKGIPLIIECADRLINGEDRHDLYFVHCGDGPDLERYRERVRALQLTERFFLPGARPDYREILPGCDIGLHASRGEGFSLAVLEIMSAALPIVVPDNSGNREAVQHRETGLCYAPGSLDDLTAAVRTLLDEPRTRRDLGDAARDRVLDRFTLDRTLDAYASVVGPALTG